MPGFIDAHLHLLSFAESLITLNIRPGNGVRSVSDIQSSIHEYSKDTPPNNWIRGKGYDEFHLSEKRHPNRWDLDAATTDHPVKLTHRSSHAHVLNSLALRLVGITKETEDPPGGMVERDLVTGEPTGLLYEMGDFLAKRIPPLPSQEMEKGVQMAGMELLSNGITSFQDASNSNDLERWELFKKWKESGLLLPRVTMMLGFPAFSPPPNPLPLGEGETINDHDLKAYGIKIILDETTGRLYPSQTELDQMVFEIHEAGWPVAIHAIEENAVESAYTAIKRALKKIPKKGHRHRIEHCSICSPNLAGKIAKIGIMVITQPSFIYYNGDRYLRTVPDKSLPHLYPLKTLITTGVMIAGSSDCPIVPLNPLIGIYAAVTRMSETGHRVASEQAIPLSEALKFYTIHAAQAIGEEKHRGSITPGKCADLVVLNENPFSVPLKELKNLEVEMTILDGEVVWEKKK